MRIRSIKVRPDSCTIATELKDKIFECYGAPNEENELKTDWIAANNANVTIPYGSEKAPGWYSPHTKISYTGNGHFIDISDNRAEANEIVAAVKENNFIDFATRAIFINANFYNANVDLVGVVKFSIEFISSGAIQTSAAIRCSPLIRPVRVINGDGASGFDSFVFFLEWVFYVCVLGYIVVEYRFYKKNRSTYFSSVWNVLDFVNLSFFFCVMILKVLSVIYVQSEFDSIMNSNK